VPILFSDEIYTCGNTNAPTPLSGIGAQAQFYGAVTDIGIVDAVAVTTVTW
jgi:hypothetical protein